MIMTYTDILAWWPLLFQFLVLSFNKECSIGLALWYIKYPLYRSDNPEKKLACVHPVPFSTLWSKFPTFFSVLSFDQRHKNPLNTSKYAPVKVLTGAPFHSLIVVPYRHLLAASGTTHEDHQYFYFSLAGHIHNPTHLHPVLACSLWGVLATDTGE